MDVHRVLVVDDNPNIHNDFKKVLSTGAPNEALGSMAKDLFGTKVGQAAPTSFDIHSAYQGRDGLQLVKDSLDHQNRFSVAFVDMRMPPGWDGLETVQAIWDIDPDIHVVLCTAFSDHSWGDIVASLQQTDRLLVIKKPFESVEILQCAHAMDAKWRLQRAERERVDRLEARVNERTRHLREAKEVLEVQMKERERMEVELRHAQRLEVVGQLAAGVAHEINTPIQFVGDSVGFLRDGFGDLIELLEFYRNGLERLKRGESLDALAQEARKREEDTDLEFLLENARPAFEQTQEGVRRVSSIVRAMKEFAFPPSSEAQPADINHAVKTTLEVSRGEYKHVADVVLDLGDIPEVNCDIGGINQVLLNLIVNAAHAVEETLTEKGKGTITLRTRKQGHDVVISIEDTGCGIPADIRHKVFDMFFTTKEVGKGSGQGLAIAHSVVVEKHGGKIELDSTPCAGTRLELHLPIQGHVGRGRGLTSSSAVDT